ELLEKLALPARQVDRHLYRNLDVEVAGRGRAEHRHALAAQAELRAGLRAGGDRHLGPAAVQRRHLDVAAEGRRGHGDRHAAVEIRAVALKEAVRPDRQEDVEVARRRAAHPGLAFAGQANPGAVLDSRRNVYLQGLLAMNATGPAAAFAGRLDD